MTEKSLTILLVEDNPADVRSDARGFQDQQAPKPAERGKGRRGGDGFPSQIRLLRGVQKPDVIFLDLNLPRKDGRGVLAEIKGDADLKRIPVVILTTSPRERYSSRATILGQTAISRSRRTWISFLKRSTVPKVTGWKLSRGPQR